MRTTLRQNLGDGLHLRSPLQVLFVVGTGLILAGLIMGAGSYLAQHRTLPGIMLNHLQEGDASFSAGNFDAAIDTYRTAAVLAPDDLEAFAHGLQYMAIVLIYHVREQSRQPGNDRGIAYLAGRFYLKCLALGYGLFYCWPYVFVLAGAGLAESMLMVIATINVHHFIVDRYIWRLRKPEIQQVIGTAAPTSEPLGSG